MAKLDAELRVLLSRKQFFDRHPEAGRLSIEPSDPLYIALKFHGEVSALVDAGLTLGSTLGPLAFGQTTLAGLEALASHPQVESISRQRRASLLLDDSVPDIHANQVWARSGDNFTGYTGRGVIIGILDTGIDFRHKAFRTAGGKTRILKIWDQTLIAVGTETVPGEITETTIAHSSTPLGYGVEYNDDEINDALEMEQPARSACGTRTPTAMAPTWPASPPATGHRTVTATALITTSASPPRPTCSSCAYGE